MCTVTIHRISAFMLVTMNRDEARIRVQEKPPQLVQNAHGPHYMAPIDGQAGGTWFGVNDQAVHACLLNRYLPDDSHKIYSNPNRPSRGRIIVELLAQGNEDNALEWLDEVFHPEPYPSFCLLVMGPENTYSFGWDGHNLEKRNHSGEWLMFSSSSWRTEEVLAFRQNEFDAWVRRNAPFDGLIPSIHLWQPADRMEWAPLMDRDFSATRSITQTVTDFSKRQTEMRYWPREIVHSTNTPLSTLLLPHAQNARTS